MFLLFLITVHLNARIPEKLVFWTVSYANNKYHQYDYEIARSVQMIQRRPRQRAGSC